MLTLLDPYELAATRVPLPDMPPSFPSIEVAVEEDVAAPPQAPSPDSSSRLRCWCSEG